MKNALLAVAALSLSLAPLAARANPVPPATHVAVAVAPPPPAVIVRPGATVRPPPPVARAGGRYVWRTENRLVPAHREVVRVKGRHHRAETRWIAAHYEPAGQWVWVPYIASAPRYPVAPPHR